MELETSFKELETKFKELETSFKELKTKGAEPPTQRPGLPEPDQGVGPPATSIPQLDGMGDPEPAEQDRDQIVLRPSADQAEHELAMIRMEEKLRKFDAGIS